MPIASPSVVRAVTTGLITFMALLLLWQSVRTPRLPVLPPPPKEADCIGTAIVATYPYNGAPEPPHECAVQCEDDQPRYILYTNGKATQCQELPGCFDSGEDSGITCKPPVSMSNASE